MTPVLSYDDIAQYGVCGLELVAVSLAGVGGENERHYHTSASPSGADQHSFPAVQGGAELVYSIQVRGRTQGLDR